ncbi:mitochondrial small ribosomal subunit Rsm22-domain-containing protein [Phlyctochytrium arcticum]|nr:mitochondrial small ribosomal subunit Rsm22-domain-containing protein [Phlyctochytrium arcticum]
MIRSAATHCTRRGSGLVHCTFTARHQTIRPASGSVSISHEELADLATLPHSQIAQESIVVEDALDEGESEDQLSGKAARFSPAALFAKNRIGQVVLDPGLNAFVEAEARGANRKHLRHHAERIHLALRSTGSATKLLRPSAPKMTTTTRIDDEGMISTTITSATPSPSRNKREDTDPLLIPHTLSYGVPETAAYLAVRTSPSFAAHYTILTQLAKRIPNFAPSSVLDFGAGTGVGLWVLNSLFGESITQNTAVDISEPMLSTLDRLASSAKSPMSSDSVSLKRFLPAEPAPDEQHDLVLSAFTLSDLPSAPYRTQTLLSLWAHTRDTLVLIDRGTPLGSQLLREARALLLNLPAPSSTFFTPIPTTDAPGKTPSTPPAEAHTLLPCPHDHPCPFPTQSRTSWCHFSQRVQRDKTMREVKQNGKTARPEEDVKYSYLVLRKGPRPTSTLLQGSNAERTLAEQAMDWPRLIAPPMKRDGHILLDVCTAVPDTSSSNPDLTTNETQTRSTLLRTIITKSKHGKAAYLAARKSYWGDLWSFPVTSGVEKPLVNLKKSHKSEFDEDDDIEADDSIKGKSQRLPRKGAGKYKRERLSVSDD